MIVYRQATFGNPLRTEPGRRAGRYHTGSETSPTQYLCLHPLGPFAEFIRGHSVRLPDQVLQVRERTWALQLEQDELLDDDPTRCQELANELRAADIPGMVVPSAALPGTRNVVLFGPRVGSPYLLEPLSAIDVPASITAHDGRPIVSLLELVRFRGDTHAGLDAWQRGDHLEFDEPDWELAQR
jgi:RES domain